LSSDSATTHYIPLATSLDSTHHAPRATAHAFYVLIRYSDEPDQVELLKHIERRIQWLRVRHVNSGRSVTMRTPIVALSLVALTAFVPQTQAGGDRNADGISVAIVVAKDNAGTPTIERAGKFQVVFTNQSNKPIRLWSDECQLGHDMLSFQVENDSGKQSLMTKRAVSPSAWTNKRPQTVTIEPGETFAWDVGLAEFFWGDRMWKDVPEPNTGKLVTLTAVVEIKASDAAKGHGVWTGRAGSKPIKTLIVDPKLRTPNQYLWEQCPMQALSIMKADPTWVTKKDDMECTPLHHAARFGFVEVTRWLLTNGAEVNARAINYFTPQYFADNAEIVKLLIDHKADVNATSNGGTALEKAADRYAIWDRFPESAVGRDEAKAIVKLLLGAGAEYDIRSACLGPAQK
jgi:hypothetical protein